MISEWCFVCEASGTIKLASPAACHELGYAADELVGRKLEEISHTESGHINLESVLAAAGDGYAVLELGLIRKDGSIVRTGGRAARFSDGDSSLQVFMFRQPSNAAYDSAHLAQTQKLEAIGQLAAGIAHEINTPTQYVGDNTRFLQDAFEGLIKVQREYERLLAAALAGEVTEELIKEVQYIAQAADVDYLMAEVPDAISQSLDGVDQIARIVRAMKEFSHPGTGEKAFIDINNAIENTVTVSRNEWKYVAEVVLNLDPALPMAPCLPGAFNQVLLNIIVNAAHAIDDAVKAAPGTKGTITVETTSVDDYVQIKISDTGLGIPEHCRHRVYDPFFTTKDLGKGTGQGLALSYAIVVDKHGGTITFETETGKGTTFILRFPASVGPGEEIQAA